MKVHLVDGTYELFRNYFGAPPKQAPDGREVGATLGLLRSLLMLLTAQRSRMLRAPSIMSSNLFETISSPNTKQRRR